MDFNKPSSNGGVIPPGGYTAPEGSDHPQDHTSSTGDVHKVSVHEKQIPKGSGLETRPLQEWDITHSPVVIPQIPKPSALSQTGIAGERIREAVLEQLKSMKPDLSTDQVHRVSDARKTEMVERIASVQKALGHEPVQAAAKQDLLLDFGHDTLAIDITLNTVMGLALQVSLAEDEILKQVNSDNRNATAWKKGIREFRALHKAWQDLHSVVTDICTHESLVVETPKAFPTPPSRQDSGFSDFDNSLLPAPLDLPTTQQKQSDERIARLEQELAHLKQTQGLEQQLAAKDQQIAALELSGSHVQLQKEVSQLKEELRKKPVSADLHPEVVDKNQQLQSQLHRAQQIAQELEPLKASRRALEAELREKSSQIVDLTRSESKAQDEIRSIQGELREAQSAVQELIETERVLKGQVQFLESSEQKARSEFEILRLDFEQFKSDQQQRTRELESIHQSRLKEKELELKQLQEEKEAAISGVESVSGELSMVRETVVRLELEASQLKDQHISDLQGKDSEIKELRSQLDSLEQKHKEEDATLRDQLVKAQSDLSGAQQKYERDIAGASTSESLAQEQLRGTTRELASLQQELEKVRTEHSVQAANLADLESSCTLETKARKVKESRVASLEEQLEALQSTLDEHQAAFENERQATRKLSSQLAYSQTEAASTRASLETALQGLEAAEEKALNTGQAHKKEIQALTGKLYDSEQSGTLTSEQLSEQRKLLAQFQKDKELVVKQVEQLEVELSTAREALKTAEKQRKQRASELKSGHQSELKNLEKTHQEAVSILEGKLDSALDDLQNERDDFKSKIARLERSQADIQSSHVSAMEKAEAAAQAHLRGQLASLESKQKHETEHLKKEQQEALQVLSRTISDHEQKLSDALSSVEEIKQKKRAEAVSVNHALAKALYELEVAEERQFNTDQAHLSEVADLKQTLQELKQSEEITTRQLSEQRKVLSKNLQEKKQATRQNSMLQTELAALKQSMTTADEQTRQRVLDLVSRHQSDLQVLEEEHTDAIALIEGRLDKAQEDLQDRQGLLRSDIAQLKQSKKDLEEQLTISKSSREEETDRLKREHKDALNEVRTILSVRDKELEDLRRQLEKDDAERLTPGELDSKGVQANTGDAETAIQQDKTVLGFVRAFRRSDSHSDSEEPVSLSSSGTVSGYESGFEPDEEGSGNTTSLKSGSPGAVRLEVMVDSSFDRLAAVDITGGKNARLEIAYERMMKQLNLSRSGLNHKVALLKEKDRQKTYSAHKNPPSHTDLRVGLEEVYTAYAEELVRSGKGFMDYVVAKQDYSKESVQKVEEALDLAIKGARAFASDARTKQRAFSGEIKKYHELLDQVDGDAPDQAVHSAYVSIKVAMARQKDQEIRDYIICSFVNAAARVVQKSAKEAIARASTNDGKRRALEQHKSYLQGLMPSAFPLGMGDKLGSLSTEYIVDAITRGVEDLENDLVLKEVKGENNPDVRGRSGLKVAREMIADPKVRPVILSLLSSLKGRHEDVDTNLNYYQASEAGLKFIRGEFGLLQMPTMSELLTAAIADLESPGSLLVTESERQHRGQLVDKRGRTRREKLLALCETYQDKEKAAETDAKVHLRGQTLSAGQLARHPHAYVLDCFKPESTHKVFDTSQLGRSTVTEVGTVTEVSSSTHGLMNNFLCDTPMGATLLTNEAAQVRSIQLKKGQPEGVQFRCSVSGQWQVSLANSMWTVDPAFILDNPNLVIPFEGEVSGKHRQDWVPVKSRSGETAVLVLQKIPGEVRYFLYEKGEGNTLVPRVIGHEDPHQEKREAMFLYEAARFGSDSSGVKPANGPHVKIVEKVSGATLCWQKKNVQRGVLQAIYDQSCKRLAEREISSPVSVARQTEDLNDLQITKTPAHQIVANKRSRSIASGLVSEKGIKAEHNGRHLHVYQSELYPGAATPATFEEVGKTFTSECPKAKSLKDKWVESQNRQRDEFRNGAFKQLFAYHGCELKPEVEQSRASQMLVEGTPEYAGMVLRKVQKVNRNHRMRLAQQLDADTTLLTAALRATNSELMSTYSDREIVNMAITAFESGNIPDNLPPTLKKQDYIQLLTGIMLVRNDLEQSTRLGDDQARLMGQLETLERSASLLKSSNAAEYQRLCQQFNLEQALLATRQEEITGRLASYYDETLSNACRARLSFEAGVHTVLRDSQVSEVNEALAQISAAMSASGGTMSRISQKGTGWGKSTIVQLLSDHACSSNLGHAERSVLVIAPVSNQAELDITLGRYYASKERHYRSLNILRDYSSDTAKWWTPENIDRIHNTLLGVDPETKPGDRALAVEKVRAPVGASVKDVQILLQLRHALQRKTRNPMEEQSLHKLDAVVDLIRKSMVFCDEWDSTLMPPEMEELQGMTNDINQALRQLSSGVMPADVVRSHGQMVLGCNMKLLMSATTASDYTEALVSGEVEPQAIKAACHTDPFTTQQRFWHWLNSAQLIYIDSTDADSANKIMNEVVEIVGTDREIMVFDGNQKEQNGYAQAFRDNLLLTEARRSRGGNPRGNLFYDAQKRLHMYLPGHARYGAQGGAPVPPEEEQFIRDTHGDHVDVSLGQAQSIGTDAPQGKRSVGVHIGLLEQGDEGRLNYIAQQFGRMKRAHTDLRQSQDLFVVINESALNNLKAGKKYVETFERAQGLMRASREHLEKTLGQPFGQCTPEQKKIIYGVIAFDNPPATPASSSALDLTRALANEIKRLSDNEWPKAEFSKAQIKALKEYKSREWRMRKTCLKLIAAELAVKEVSPLVKECEQKLQEAKVDSYLDQVFADEHDWLQTGQKGTLEQWTLAEPVKGMFDSARVAEFVRQGLVQECRAKLASIPRRAAKVTGQIEQAEQQMKGTGVREAIETALKEMETDGTDLSALSALDINTGEYTSKQGSPLTVRQKLQAESLGVYEQGLTTVNDVIAKFESYKGMGVEPINKKRAKLLVQMKLVRENSRAAVQAAINTDAYMKQFYLDVMDLSHNVALSSGLNREQYQPLMNEIIETLSSAVDIDPNFRVALTGRGYKSATDVIAEYEGAKKRSAQPFCTEKEYLAAQALIRSKEARKVHETTYHAMVWKKNVAKKREKARFEVTRERPGFAVKTSAMRTPELTRVVKHANDLQGMIDDQETAREFCSSPERKEYQACIGQLREHVLNELERWEDSVREKAERDVNKIREQQKFMQMRIAEVNH